MANDIGYFSVHMGIYPRTLFIIKGNVSKSVYDDNFTDREGNKLVTDFKGSNNGSCMWSIIERKTKKYGYLVRLHRIEHKGDLAHEAVHVALETFRDIDAEVDLNNQEPFAYLVGWVTKQLYNALNYKRE